MKAYINAYKLRVGNCTDCKFAVTKAPLPYFQFDHLDDTNKLYDVSRAPTSEKFDSEVKKCELVCRPCHYIRSSVRRVSTGNARAISILMAEKFGHLVMQNNTNKKRQLETTTKTTTKTQTTTTHTTSGSAEPPLKRQKP